MQYDTNSQTTRSLNNSHFSSASEQDPSKSSLHTSSSASLELCEELAFIKREVATLKEQVWNRVHEDLGSSEECSVQNSFTETQPDYLSADRFGNSHRTQKTDHDSNTSFIPAPSGYKNVAPAQDLTFYNKTTSRSRCSSDAIENKETNYPVEGALFSESILESNSAKRGELSSNGIIVNTTAALEGKLFAVASINNGISRSIKDTEGNPFLRKPVNSNGSSAVRIQALNTQLEEMLRTDINHSEGSSMRGRAKPKYRELVSAIEEEVIVPASQGNERRENNIEGLFKRKFEPSLGSASQQEPSNWPDLSNINSRGLDLDNHEDSLHSNQMLRKNLSIIFSTNESVQSTPPQSVTRRGPMETSENVSPMESHRSARSAVKDHREMPNSGRDEYNNHPQESKHSARSEISSRSEDLEGKDRVTTGNGVSTLGSEESFAGLLYVSKLQSRGNKDLEEKLNRLGDLYDKKIGTYEQVIQILNEKNEKYGKGNELLVRTLKTCEREIDTLALNNRTLHQNVIMFEEDAHKRKIKEQQLNETLHNKQRENDSLREELRRRDLELDELKKKMAVSTTKTENVKLYAKSCEDSIYAIDQTLKRVMFDKGNTKLSSTIVTRVLESILAETSKFVEKLDTSSSVIVVTSESENNKSPRLRDNGRFFTSFGTETSQSTYDEREKMNRGRSEKKSKPNFSDFSSTTASPQLKTSASAKKPSNDRSPGPDNNRILLQKLLNETNAKQRSLSSNKKSKENFKSTEREYQTGETVDLKAKKTTSSHIIQRGATSPPPRSRTPEKSTSAQKKRINADNEKIKENLRKKVISNLSPISQKKRE